MVFWLFKKRDNKEFHEKIDKVHQILRQSFSNVKKDMDSLGEWQKSLDLSHKNHNGKLDTFEIRLRKVEKQLNELVFSEQLPQKKSEEIKNEFEEASLIDKNMLSGAFKTLTSTHKRIFLALYHLQKQLGTNKVSYKSLASVLYTNKSYPEIRSTLSQYISFLEDYGMVEKTRKGKESYIGITDPGFDILESLDEPLASPKTTKKV